MPHFKKGVLHVAESPLDVIARVIRQIRSTAGRVGANHPSSLGCTGTKRRNSSTDPTTYVAEMVKVTVAV